MDGTVRLIPTGQPAAVSARVPGDKSLTHRAVLLGLMAEGESRADHALEAEDIGASIRLAQAFGARVTRHGETLVIISDGVGGLREPPDVIDCGNSGTTMRLGAGVAATMLGLTVLTGDASLRRRPMARVLEPLSRLGVLSQARGRGLAPVAIRGGLTRGGYLSTPIPSAQVKSALLLAALAAPEPVTVSEALPTRDHTERLLSFAGVRVERKGLAVTVYPGRPRPLQWTVAGDPSSAAFWWVLAALTGGRAETPAVLLNPGRIGVVEHLKAAGAVIASQETESVPEPLGTVTVTRQELLTSFRVDGTQVPAVIDELPLLAVLATQCRGVTMVEGAGELKVKESDRILAMAEGLNRMGARVEPRADGWRIEGPTALKGAEVSSYGDHRVAMALAVAAAVAAGETVIQGAGAVSISYPAFWETLGASGSVQVVAETSRYGLA
jgi:3-phosphoshikimate 1-carboxyvinyltransferase